MAAPDTKFIFDDQTDINPNIGFDSDNTNRATFMTVFHLIKVQKLYKRIYLVMNFSPFMVTTLISLNMVSLYFRQLRLLMLAVYSTANVL